MVGAVRLVVMCGDGCASVCPHQSARAAISIAIVDARIYSLSPVSWPRISLSQC